MKAQGRVKPSKPASVFGIIGVVIVTILGLSIGVTDFGAFGVIWILFALGIVAYYLINLTSEHGIAEKVIDIDVPAPSQPEATSAKSTENRLRDLEELKQKRLVSEAEYQQQREKILGDL